MIDADPIGGQVQREMNGMDLSARFRAGTPAPVHVWD